MKTFRLFVATIAMTFLALFPALGSAADIDDLEVTMKVLDNVAELDGNVLEMRGPGSVEGDVEIHSYGEDVDREDRPLERLRQRQRFRSSSWPELP